MENLKHEFYWNDIPTEKCRAVSYNELVEKWNTCERNVRWILNKLSSFDNGDNYVLIRSARNKGFYKTDDLLEIRKYKQEILNRGRNIFAQCKKMNRILNANSSQFAIENNLRVVRELKGLRQADVCKELNKCDKGIDKSMLSKMENGVCLPTPYQLSILAEIYGCEPFELVNGDLYY